MPAKGRNRIAASGKEVGVGQSFPAVFEAEFAPLLRYLQRRVGASVVEDLTAETFAIAFRRWNDLDPSRPVRPWLYGIAANLLRHHWRAERRMLRTYARTGADPVLEESDLVIERLDADASARELEA